jgi:hypothetical protein
MNAVGCGKLVLQEDLLKQGDRDKWDTELTSEERIPFGKEERRERKEATSSEFCRGIHLTRRHENTKEFNHRYTRINQV